MAVEIRVLGRVDALADGRALRLRGSKQRAVLAMLALRANRTVGADELIDGLWGEDPPASAAKNLQLYVSQLRKALDAGGPAATIVTHGRGYELQLTEDAVDATRFERLVEEAAREPASAGGERRRQRRARALARGAARRRRLRAVRGRRDRQARGASPAGDRACDRRRPRRRAPRRGDPPAGGADRGGAAPRAPLRPANACPLSRRAPVRRAGRLPPSARGAGRTDRGRARA